MPTYENIEVSCANATSDFGSLHQYTSVTELAEAVATATTSRLLELSTTAEATSSAWFAYAAAVDERANATDTESLKWTSTLALGTSANATAEWTSSLTLALASSAAATAAADGRPVFAYNSLAAATAALTGARKSVAVLTGTAEATSGLYEAYSALLTSSAVASSAYVVQRTTHQSETSSAAATSAFTGLAARVVYSLSSAAVAHDAPTLQLHATGAYGATANAYATLRSLALGGTAYWSNAHTTAAATWDIGINSAVQSGATIYAAGPAGLYRLQDDSSEEVFAEIVYDLSDFNSIQRKKFDVIYVAGDSAGPFGVVATNEQGSWEYTTHLPEAAAATNHRAQLGRGLISRYLRVTLSNPDGGMFSVNEVSFLLGDTPRRR
jgi:hypothetical protein